MKKIALILFLLLPTLPLFSQEPDLDALLPKIAAEKNDSIRYYLAFSALTVSETNPVQDMDNAERILVLGQQMNDPVCLVMGLGCLGYDYRAFGNTAKSLEYNLQTNAIAEKSNVPRMVGLGKLLLSMNYMDLGDNEKAASYGLAAVAAADKSEINIFSIMSYVTLGEIYLKMNKTDSALILTQKAFELSTRSGIKEYLGAIFGQLGQVYSITKNNTLAISYFNSALDEAFKINSPKYISLSYYSIASYYHSLQQNDSAILYAKKAIAAVQHTPFSTLSISPAKLLLDLYRDNHVDSAFKYSEMHRVANDSLYNIKAVQQAQLMTFEEDARQQELVVEKTRSEEKRKQNLQFALIALVILCFTISFLLLSRSLITNTNTIRFLGVVTLLVVFEFLNLLLHPFLEHITHHSPVWMLLALVCLAALLVPLHHKLEKWIIHRLVEKNKRIRLAAAKKTIAQLEKDN